MLLTKNKITSKAYCHKNLEYNVVCLPVLPMDTEGVQGGVGLVIRERPQVWSMELTRFHMVS